MAISMVEMQGMVPRQQDFQIMKQNEDSKVLVDQNNYQIQGEKKTVEAQSKVNQQDDTSASRDGNENNKNAYHGDGGRKRKQNNEGVVIKKNKTTSFDLRV